MASPLPATLVAGERFPVPSFAGPSSTKIGSSAGALAGNALAGGVVDGGGTSGASSNDPPCCCISPAKSKDISGKGRNLGTRQRKMGSGLTLGAASRAKLRADGDSFWHACKACRGLVARGSLRPLCHPFRQGFCITAETRQSKAMRSIPNLEDKGCGRILTLPLPVPG